MRIDPRLPIDRATPRTVICTTNRRIDPGSRRKIEKPRPDGRVEFTEGVESCRIGSTSALGRPMAREDQEVNIVTTRFGLIHADETDVIRIPEGLVGFRNATLFVLFPDPESASLYWLQSVTSAELAFGLVAPPIALDDYQIELRPADRSALELDDEREALTYLILNRTESGILTVNLQGPLVFNPVRRLGRQLVLTSSRHAVRFPLERDLSEPRIGVLQGPSSLRATA